MRWSELYFDSTVIRPRYYNHSTTFVTPVGIAASINKKINK